MPGLKTTTYGTGDYSWMLNTDGLDQSVTGVLDVSTFTAGTHYPNGFIPSGTAIGQVTATKLFGPYDDTKSDGTQTLYGFTYADVRAVRQNGSTASKVGTGAVVSGAVSVSKLPLQSGAGSVDANGKADTPTIRYEA